MLSPGETLARLGGDEFAVVLPETTRQRVTAIAGKLRESLEASFVLDGQWVEVGASIGIARYPEHGRDTETLLRYADGAMYRAKRANGLRVEPVESLPEDQPNKATVLTITVSRVHLAAIAFAEARGLLNSDARVVRWRERMATIPPATTAAYGDATKENPLPFTILNSKLEREYRQLRNAPG